MLYSRYHGKKDEKLVELEAKQREEIKKANEEKMKAVSHAEKLAIEAKKRSNLVKLANEYHDSLKSDDSKKKPEDAEEKSEEKKSKKKSKKKAE